MKILVINCGSSSIKYQLYQADTDQVYAKGMISRIGEEFSHIDHQAGTATIQKEVPGLSYSQGFREIIENLVDPKVGVITDTSEISAVGHRAVHGGATFIKSTIVSEDVIKQIEDCIPLAPLHNPANLIGIREAMKLLPGFLMWLYLIRPFTKRCRPRHIFMLYRMSITAPIRSEGTDFMEPPVDM